MKPLAILTLCLLIAGCGNDDDIDLSCMQSDWVGTYTGTRSCDGGAEVNVTVTISASGSQLMVSYVTGTTVVTPGEPIDFTGCQIDEDIVGQGANYSIKATLDGNELELEDRLVFGSAIGPLCQIRATKN
ncbi:MAG: hypothetical protein AAFO91_04580 [Bacteroidota bacterium]